MTVDIHEIIADLFHEKLKNARVGAALEAVLAMHPEARPLAEKILDHKKGA